jgi:hypothetical protein
VVSRNRCIRQMAPIDHTMSGGRPLLLDEFEDFNSTLKYLAETTHLALAEAIFPIWYKTYQYLDARTILFEYHPLTEWDMQSGFAMIHTRCWAQIWRALGVSFGLDLSNRTVQCEYSRCAAPDTVLAWECADCNLKRYCSRRCQQAYVLILLYCTRVLYPAKGLGASRECTHVRVQSRD